MSKLIFEDILKQVAEKHNLKTVIFRYFNVAGADKRLRSGQIKKPATHLIKIAAEAACGKRKNMFLFGNDYETFDGSCIRDYIHITDLAELHHLAIQYCDLFINTLCVIIIIINW